MTWALVGSAGAAVAESGGNISPLFGQGTTATNTLVAWVTGATSGVPNPIATTATGWVRLVSTSQNGDEWAELWARANCGTSEAPPVFSVANSYEVGYSKLAEFSGSPTTVQVDKSGSATASAAPVTVTNTGADAAPGDLVLCCAIGTDSIAPASLTMTMTGPSGAALSVTQYVNLVTTTTYAFGWAIAAGSGANADSATVTSNQFQYWAAVLASLKPAGGAPTTNGNFLSMMRKRVSGLFEPKPRELWRPGLAVA